MKVTAKNLAKLPDGRHLVEPNLYVVVRDEGKSRSYVYRYTINGSRKDLSLGNPAVKSLATARQEAARCRVLLSKGIDPKSLRDASRAKAQETFPTFKAYVEERAPEIVKVKCFKNLQTGVRLVRWIRDYAYPFIGDTPINEVKPENIRDLLLPIWTTKHPTASTLRSYLETVFDYARRDGVYMDMNPAVWRGVQNLYLPPPKKVHEQQHRPAPTIPMLKNDLLTFTRLGCFGCGRAIVFGAATATRRGEWLNMRWDEVDMERRIWSIPPARRKDGRPFPHRVPLSDQAMAILKAQPWRTGYVWRKRYHGGHYPLAMSAPLQMLFRYNEKAYCLHGFRSTFRDWAAESGVSQEVAEKSLMHSLGNEVVSAYLRSDLLEARRPVMQDWANAILPMDALNAALDESQPDENEREALDFVMSAGAEIEAPPTVLDVLEGEYMAEKGYTVEQFALLTRMTPEEFTKAAGRACTLTDEQCRHLAVFVNVNPPEYYFVLIRDTRKDWEESRQ